MGAYLSPTQRRMQRIACRFADHILVNAGAIRQWLISDGYDSDRFHGGEYSIQATRVPREKVLSDRPPLPRKVLGELVVLKVEKGTSVALITRTTAEVQIGDFVQRSN